MDLLGKSPEQVAELVSHRQEPRATKGRGVTISLSPTSPRLPIQLFRWESFFGRTLSPSVHPSILPKEKRTDGRRGGGPPARAVSPPARQMKGIE